MLHVSSDADVARVLVPLLMILCFAVRLFGARRSEIAFDTYGHLYLAKEVKEQKAGPFGSIRTKAVGSTEHRDPFLWHWLIGFFPIDRVFRFQRWINPAIDAFFTVLLYLIALRLGFERDVALLIALLYLLTPAWFSRLGPPRISSLTPRLGSELATNLFFIVIFLPLGMAPWLSLVVAVLLADFVLLSSKFGVQAMLFLVPLTSLLARNHLPLTALTLAIVLAILVTRGGFLKTIAAQARFLAFYFRKNIRGEVAVSRRNSLRKLFERPDSRGGKSYVVSVIYRLVAENGFTSVLLKMPVLVAAWVLYSVSRSGPDFPQITAPVIATMTAGTILFFLVNLPPLLFLGEAERYLHHVAFFIVASAAAVAMQLDLLWVLWLIVGYGVAFWCLENALVDRLTPESRRIAHDADAAIITDLNSLDEPGVVLCYPYQAVSAWRVMLETPHRVILRYTTSREFSELYDRKYSADDARFVRLERLDDMSNELGVDYLIAHRKSLLEQGLDKWQPSPDWQKLDVGEPRYAVYRRRSPS